MPLGNDQAENVSALGLRIIILGVAIRLCLSRTGERKAHGVHGKHTIRLPFPLAGLIHCQTVKSFA